MQRTRMGHLICTLGMIDRAQLDNILISTYSSLSVPLEIVWFILLFGKLENRVHDLLCRSKSDSEVFGKIQYHLREYVQIVSLFPLNRPSKLGTLFWIKSLVSQTAIMRIFKLLHVNLMQIIKSLLIYVYTRHAVFSFGSFSYINDWLFIFYYRELYSNNISGPIPNDLGNLTSLVSLDLYLNSFTGPIPETLGKLSKLRFL